MPRLKPTLQAEQNKSFKAVVESGKIRQEISNKDLAKVMGKTVRTVQYKIQNPETMTLADIRLWIRLLKLDKDQVIELVGGAYEK